MVSNHSPKQIVNEFSLDGNPLARPFWTLRRDAPRFAADSHRGVLGHLRKMAGRVDLCVVIHQREEKLKVLLRRGKIERRVEKLGHQIARDFRGQRVHLVGVLKGACYFLADLSREIDLEVSLDFIAVASYGRGKESSGQVRMFKDLDSSVQGMNVILVEDILDTGFTLNYLLRLLRQRKPR